MATDPAKRRLPSGEKYVEIVRRHEHEAVSETEKFFASFGEKAPKAWTRVKDGLVALDGLGSCHWGCAEGDHVRSTRSAVHAVPPVLRYCYSSRRTTTKPFPWSGRSEN
jgi:hypothetical protein